MKRFILITGGEFVNKGAQAMTFITISEIKKRFPRHEIVVLSDCDYERTPYEKRNFNFLIRSTRIYTKRLYDPFDIWSQKHLITERRSDDMIHILENTDFMIDVSGYALSSQRGIDLSLEFLHRIYVAKYYGIKVFLLPQSFGPFEYEKPYTKVMDFLLKTLLKYPQLICAREEDGYFWMKKYCNGNLLKCDDMVWNNHNEVILSELYKEQIPVHEISVTTENNVAIVPNIRLIQYGDGKLDYINFYSDIINYLLSQSFHVYLVPHSNEDINLCKAIKGAFTDKSDVIDIDTELNYWEYEEIIEKMDFIVASRFHSIVHAYKKCVPGIIIGWAEKYRELAKIVQQERYVVDIRKEVTSKQIIDTFEVLYQNAEYERQKIAKAVDSSKKKESIFEEIYRRGMN